MDLYVTATRGKFRFPSNAGHLTLEQLWDLPLSHRTGLDLDNVAKTINADLKSLSEESFVSTTKNARTPELEAKLEIVKHIIATKLAEADAVKKAADRKAERQKIMDALARANDAELASLSKDDLLKRLAALD